jgi:glycine betaine/proline transport system substrate-binding protein
MTLFKKSSLAAFTIALGAMAPSLVQAECGDVSIAEMTWASTQAAARVDQFILKHG